MLIVFSKLTNQLFIVMGLALLISVVGNPVSANPINVNVGGNPYTLTTIEGSFNSLETLLESQPWWMNEPLTDEFATAMQGGLGYPHVGSGNLSPFLALSDTAFGDPNILKATMWRQSDNSILDLAIGRSQTDFISGLSTSPITWVITTVPEPSSVLIAVTGLLFCFSKRRTQRYRV